MRCGTPRWGLALGVLPGLLLHACEPPPEEGSLRDTVSGVVLIDYGQFYVYGDPEAIGREDPPRSWEEMASGVWSGSEYLTVYAPRPHGPAPVTIQLLDEAPVLDTASWDNVVETSLDLPTSVVVADSWDHAEAVSVELAVRPGTYRIRILGSGFDRAELAEEGDRYLLQLWPDAHAPPVSLKVWAGFVRRSEAS